MTRKTPAPWTCPNCHRVFKQGGWHIRACTMDRKAAFFEKVVKTPTCWLWTGAKRWDGYGLLVIRYKQHSAHRMSWEWANGPIPKGQHVLHKCDTPSCVRPDHLFLGTHQENMTDRTAKGRQTHGEKNPHALLTEQQVREIRRDFRCEGQRSNLKEIAARYPNATEGAVYQAARRYSWKYLP